MDDKIYELIYFINTRRRALETVRRTLDQLMDGANEVEKLAFSVQKDVNDASIAELDMILEYIDNNFKEEE